MCGRHTAGLSLDRRLLNGEVVEGWHYALWYAHDVKGGTSIEMSVSQGQSREGLARCTMVSPRGQVMHSKEQENLSAVRPSKTRTVYCDITTSAFMAPR